MLYIPRTASSSHKLEEWVRYYRVAICTYLCAQALPKYKIAKKDSKHRPPDQIATTQHAKTSPSQYAARKKGDQRKNNNGCARGESKPDGERVRKRIDVRPKRRVDSDKKKTIARASARETYMLYEQDKLASFHEGDQTESQKYPGLGRVGSGG